MQVLDSQGSSARKAILYDLQEELATALSSALHASACEAVPFTPSFEPSPEDVVFLSLIHI